MAKKETNSVEAQLKARWGADAIEAGWTAVPNVLIEKQAAIGLDPVDLNIVLHVAKYWWRNEQSPYAAKTRIAEQLGISPRTVQRRITALEKSGLIARITRKWDTGGQAANAFDFGGLIRAMQPFAREVLQERRRRQAEAAGRRSRKRPLPTGRDAVASEAPDGIQSSVPRAEDVLP